MGEAPKHCDIAGVFLSALVSGCIVSEYDVCETLNGLRRQSPLALEAKGARVYLKESRLFSTVII